MALTPPVSVRRNGFVRSDLAESGSTAAPRFVCRGLLRPRASPTQLYRRLDIYNSLPSLSSKYVQLNFVRGWRSSRIYQKPFPALITVQPPISIVHCKALNNLLNSCYSLPCIP